MITETEILERMKNDFEGADLWYVEGAPDAVRDLADALEYINVHGGALYAHTGPLCWEYVPSLLLAHWLGVA